MRFHILGLSNAPIDKNYTANPFTVKCFHMANMLTTLGYEVFCYGVEGGTASCKEYVNCLPKTYYDFYYPYDQQTQGYDYNNMDAWRDFNRMCVNAINERKQKGDVLLCPLGAIQDVVRDYTGLPCVEFSIGHTNSSPKNYRIFESQSWANYVYGTENRQLPPKGDTVIHAFFDSSDYLFNSFGKQDYLLFMGRLIPEKGIDIAVRVAEETRHKLIVCGNGDHRPESEYVEYRGVVGLEERKNLLCNAKATIVPSQYNEPFGAVAGESLMSATPLITSNRGALPEINLHERTGYVCWRESDYIQAVYKIKEIDSNEIFRHAIRFTARYAMFAYQRYFNELESEFEQEYERNIRKY